MVDFFNCAQKDGALVSDDDSAFPSSSGQPVDEFVKTSKIKLGVMTVFITKVFLYI